MVRSVDGTASDGADPQGIPLADVHVHRVVLVVEDLGEVLEQAL